MDFKNMTVREYLSEERSTCELEQVRYFLCDVISKAKEGDDEAFRQLLGLKDMKSFIKYTTARVQSKLNYVVPKETVVNEVYYSIYTFINQCYQTHSEVNELQVLISSLAKWLPSNVAYSLYETTLPKKDDYLVVGGEGIFSVIDDVEFNLFLLNTLTKEEFALFSDIYVDCKTNVQISREMGIAESTVRYRNKQLLCKLKDELTVC